MPSMHCGVNLSVGVCASVEGMQLRAWATGCSSRGLWAGLSAWLGWRATLFSLLVSPQPVFEKFTARKQGAAGSSQRSRGAQRPGLGAASPLGARSARRAHPPPPANGAAPQHRESVVLSTGKRTWARALGPWLEGGRAGRREVCASP
jgi:hypothetical protein